jgi:hypothetical protein
VVEDVSAGQGAAAAAVEKAATTDESGARTPVGAGGEQ